MTRPKLFNIWILLGGVLTSLLAMGLVGYLRFRDVNIMGFYIMHIVPVGAILTGLVSGMGYAIASRLSNVKVRFEFFLVILFGGIATYAFSHLTIYVLIARDMSFLDYYRQTCEGMTFYDHDTKHTSGPVGAWGYGYQLLQILGLSLGALVPVLVVGTLPYCERCQVYLSSLGTRSFLSTLKRKDWKSAPKAEKRQILVDAIQQVTEAFYQWYSPLQSADGDAVEDAFEELNKKLIQGRLAIVGVTVYRCNECDGWELIAKMTNINANGGFNFKVLVDTNTDTQAKVPPRPQPPPLPPTGKEPGSTHIQE